MSGFAVRRGEPKSSLSSKFFAGSHGKYGYTPRGVRDEVTTEDGRTHYFLWGNRIATFDKNKDTLAVRDTGWKTVTTKDRINSILREKNLGSVRSEKGKWLIEIGEKKYEWSDGDNVFDMKTPAKHLKAFDVEKAKAESKGSMKERNAFIQKVKDEIDKGEADYSFLHNLLQKRGYRMPDMFLQDPKRYWGTIKASLSWYWRQPASVKEEIGERNQ